MSNNNALLIFVLILTGSVAILLTGLREVTKPQADLNEKIFNKRAVLAAVEAYLPDGKTVKELSDDEVLKIFDDKIQQVSLNMGGEEEESVLAEDIDMAKEKKKDPDEQVLPLFIFNQGEEKFYIISVRGNGLWDEIWGNIAISSDLNTIAGASFDHKAETPGLGAEIKDNPSFPAKFKGKQIYKGDEYVSVDVVKGPVKEPNHQVDGITGATVTSVGVAEMLYRGIKYYEPYFEKLKSSDGKPLQTMLLEVKK